MVSGGLNLITMNKTTSQEKKWKGRFGKDYTSRNSLRPADMDRLYLQNYGITRTRINKEFVGNLNRSIKVLEVGSNIGTQLTFLQKMGFKHLYGIEINREAIELSKRITRNIDIMQGSAVDIPFKDSYFDIVFTSGLLIHISPSDIKKVIKEIYRCTKKYIWGFEYYADNYTEIVYRGKKNMLWKANFPKLYRDNFEDLRLIKERRLKYRNDENIDIMFLLRKQ